MQITFAQAERAIGTPTALRAEVRSALRNDTIFNEISPYLQPPGVCGSKGYDQGVAADRLLSWDAKHNAGKIALFKPSHRELWGHMYAVLSAVFQTSQGRVMGLLESKPANPEETEAAAAKEAASPGSGGDIQ